MPGEQGSRLQRQREHAGRRGRSRDLRLWEEEQEGGALPEESGSLGIPGMHAGASGQQGLAPACLAL